ncbi:MAG: exodeoxyribonuclease VII small subunit [Coriobacteriia bacterium]|nr:exodeoxyribonuclease VII small subunit [Coriobacteriia bacterium]
MANETKNIKDMTFREAMDELNKTVTLLEGDTLELEESLEKYKFGVELLAHLKGELNNAQVQVEELMGKIEAEDMSDEKRDTTLS